MPPFFAAVRRASIKSSADISHAFGDDPRLPEWPLARPRAPEQRVRKVRVVVGKHAMRLSGEPRARGPEKRPIRFRSPENDEGRLRGLRRKSRIFSGFF